MKKRFRLLTAAIAFTICLFACACTSFAGFTVTLKADPEEGGTVAGGGEFEDGQNTVLIATPNEGYTFLGWYRENGELAIEEAQFDFTLEASRTYIAKFEKALTAGAIAEPSIGGTVTQSGSGTYVKDEEVTLTASPNEGYSFIGWFDASSPTEAVETNQIFKFNITEPVSYIAKFAAEYRLDVNISPEEGGTVIGTGIYPGGSIVSLEAVPNEDYRFTGWVSPADPDTVISSDSHYRQNLDENLTLTATFDHSYAYIGARVALWLIIIGGGGLAFFIFYRHSQVIKRKNYHRPRDPHSTREVRENPREQRGHAKPGSTQSPSARQPAPRKGSAKGRDRQG